MSNKPPRQLDFEQIKAIIPQRFPFVMIDRVIDIQPGVKAVAIKNLTGNEWFYQGHFPIKAFTPGVLISEAIGQAGIVFFHFSLPKKKRPRVYLLASLKIRFLEPALPGDQLKIEITPVKLVSTGAILNGVVTVLGKVIAKGEFMLAARKDF